jgi:hypothetical protein
MEPTPKGWLRKDSGLMGVTPYDSGINKTRYTTSI